ncbi:ndufa6 NADH-ubiquinone oxidoreductase subunit [Umbelopsis nana]
MSAPYAVAHLAVTTAKSKSSAEATARALSLYRQWQKSVPEIMSLYQLSLPSSAVRAKIREEFEKNRFVEDLSVRDILIFKGTVEYQETMNLWKQETHVMRYFAKEEAAPVPTGFLDKFYEGRT